MIAEGANGEKETRELIYTEERVEMIKEPRELIADTKAQGPQKQKMRHEILKLPPIRPPQGSKPRNQSANMNLIWALKSQVWDLQQQLSEARTENKLLKKAQHRHMVAQQHFRDPEETIKQISAKHNNETKALQYLLRETRVCRDNLARQLQATERKLLNTKDTLQHLQQLSQDQSLLEREELTLRLARVTTQLEDKNMRIQV
ncbi:lebercilin-like protein [Anableps anableps]